MPGSAKEDKEREDMDALLGIDIGTGGCKITMIDTRGNVIAGGFQEYPTHHPQSGWAEQNPADWYHAVCGILKGMKAKGVFEGSAIRAISVDGSTHNAVLLGKDLEILRPVIMWTDQRSRSEAEDLEQKNGKLIFETTFQRPAPTWTLPQMLWLKRHEPGIFPKIAHILFAKDYVRYRLTGEICTDYIEAQGTLFYDVKNRRWSEELCALAGISLKTLPPLVNPSAIAGAVISRASVETGLPEGVPVIAGASDSAVEDYAAGAVEPGQCVIKLATAGNVNVMTSSPVQNRRTITYSHVVPGLWYTVTATNSAAICMRWFRDNFCCDSNNNGKNIYAHMESEALKSPVGARGLFFHPYLQGERSPYWDSDLRASFTGAAMSHTRGDFIRAIMEGVAFSLLDCKRVLDEMKIPVTQIRLIGGGAKSGLWSRIVCDIFGKELIRPESGDASFGAAILAGVGAGIFDNEKDAVAKCMKIKDVLVPDERNHEKYTKLFQAYLRIHDALSDIYKNINK